MKNIIFLFIFFSAVSAREPIGANRYEALTGVRLVKDVRSDRDRSEFITSDGQNPSKFLVENYHYIASGAKVLKVGMEGGLNAIFLARKGYKVIGIDPSAENVKRSLRRAKEFGVRIDSIQTDVEKYFIAENTFDAIVCFGDYSAKAYKKMIRGVKPGGIFIFSKEVEMAKKRRAGKLIRQYRGLEVLKYEAPVRFNDFNASIILVR